MKKIIGAVIVFAMVILGVYSETQFSWSKRLFENYPVSRSLRKQDYLSMLSLHYYGTSKYWRDIDMINRAPDVDKIFPGQTIIIPDQESIERLHKTQDIVLINQIISHRDRWLAQHKVQSLIALNATLPS
jgi:hypothetical protein